MSRNKKRKRDFVDNVDEILENSELELNANELTQKSASHHPFVNIGDYFTSPEAIIIFNPKKMRELLNVWCAVLN